MVQLWLSCQPFLWGGSHHEISHRACSSIREKVHLTGYKANTCCRCEATQLVDLLVLCVTQFAVNQVDKFDRDDEVVRLRLRILNCRYGRFSHHFSYDRRIYLRNGLLDFIVKITVVDIRLFRLGLLFDFLDRIKGSC